MTPIMLNIPNAADARKSIEKGQYEKALLQAKEVEGVISKAIKCGQTSVGFDGVLESCVKSALELKGYVVTIGRQYNESYTSISWAYSDIKRETGYGYFDR